MIVNLKIYFQYPRINNPPYKKKQDVRLLKDRFILAIVIIQLNPVLSYFSGEALLLIPRFRPHGLVASL